MQPVTEPSKVQQSSLSMVASITTLNVLLVTNAGNHLLASSLLLEMTSIFALTAGKMGPEYAELLASFRINGLILL